MGLSPVTGPCHQLLPEEPDGDHQELQDEPVVTEPEKQVGAQNDRERAEPKSPRVASRPGQQHVEGVRKHDLRDDEPGVIGHLRPVPSPVEEYAAVSHELQIVVLPQRDFARQHPARARHAPPQGHLPDEQGAAGQPERPRQPFAATNPRQETQQEQQQNRIQGQPNRGETT